MKGKQAKNYHEAYALLCEDYDFVWVEQRGFSHLIIKEGPLNNAVAASSQVERAYPTDFTMLYMLGSTPAPPCYVVEGPAGVIRSLLANLGQHVEFQ